MSITLISAANEPHERQTSVFRTVLSTIVIAGALLAPAAGAQPNTGHHSGGNPAGNVGASGGGGGQSMCAFLKEEANQASDAAYENYSAGNRKRGRHFQQVADDDYQEAHDMGCGWAA
jgi:hypothetical protein